METQLNYKEGASSEGGASSSGFGRYVLMMAGGSGTRAGGGMPKQMRPLAGIPIIVRATRAFIAEDTKVLVVINASVRDEFDSLAERYPELRQVDVCTGGSDRLESVKNGLDFLDRKYHPSPDALVAVHDAARPLISRQMIERGWLTAKEKGSAVPVVKVTDSLRHLSETGSEAIDRSQFVAVQTPQVFRFSIIFESYKCPMQPYFTDDASVCEAAGHPISLYEGEYTNIKVTAPTDFAVATALLQETI